MYDSLNFNTAILIILTLKIKVILIKSAINTNLIVANFKLAIWKSIKKISPFSRIIQSIHVADSAIVTNRAINLLIKDLLNFNIYSKITAKIITFNAKVIGRILFQAKFIKRS